MKTWELLLDYHNLKEGEKMNRKVDKKFIKYIYKDVYKSPEAVMSILKEEGLTGKQINKCMRKRHKYLMKNEKLMLRLIV